MNADYKRLLAVNRYREVPVLNAELNMITALAAAICEASIAVVSLIDDHLETLIATIGVDKQSIEIDKSICITDLLGEAVLTISDVTNHKRFAHTDLAAVAPQMRFYAGAKLTSPSGFIVGRLYVLDKKPKQLTKGQESCLQMLANQVIQCLEKEISIRTSKQQLARLLTLQVRHSEMVY